MINQSKKNILLLFGGGGSEHEISRLSANYIEENLRKIAQINTHKIEIKKSGEWLSETQGPCQLLPNKDLYRGSEIISIDFAIPCIHGPPGETGEIQAWFDLINLPYLGSGHEGHSLCFNKISTKLWLEKLDLPITPYLFLYDAQDEKNNTKKVEAALRQWDEIFIKAASQGSSVGCYKVTQKDDIRKILQEAFSYSNQVLIEKGIKARELEIACYEIQGKTIASLPGEIITPGGFYDYQQKYSSESQTKTAVVAQGVSPSLIKEMQTMAITAFNALKLRDLARIDFFLTSDHKIMINEINTFPGMTQISMFPKMMENNGHSFTQFLKEAIYEKSHSH